MSRIRRLFQNRFDTKITMPNTVHAVLGSAAGKVNVPGRDNYVYARLSNNQEVEVFNTRVIPVYDLPVVIGVDPIEAGIWQVLSVRSGLGMTYPTMTGFAPANRYRWMAPGGGQDPLFVEMRQFLPLRITPAGGMVISIYPGIIYIAGVWYMILNQDIDLTEYIPETEGMAVFVLISIDDTGDIVVGVGDEVAISNLAIVDIPEMDATQRPLGAVRLYYGQTAIYEGRSNTDIVDLRWSQGIEALSTVSWDSVSGKPDFGDLALKDLVEMADIDASGTPNIYSVLRGDGVWAPSNDHSHKDWVETSTTEALYDSALLTVNGTGDYTKAFNKNLTDQWLSTGASHWVTVAFDRPRVVKYIKITANAGDWMWADCPDDIYIYGSNIGTFTGEEVQLDHYVPGGEGIYTRNMPTPRKAYRYFKMTFGRPSHNMRVNEIQLYTLPDQLMWDGQTLAQAGISEIGHTHVEADITNLDHNAQKIKGIPVDITGLSDGEVLVYEQSTNKFIPGEGGGGSPLTVEELDGTPSVANVTQINVTNGTLTDEGGGEITLDFGSAATDGSAIHDNVANEISAITEKTTPANDDLFLIEDSEDGFAKKSVRTSSLPSGGGGDIPPAVLVLLNQNFI